MDFKILANELLDIMDSPKNVEEGGPPKSPSKARLARSLFIPPFEELFGFIESIYMLHECINF